MREIIRKILYIFSKYFGLIKIETILSKLALNDLYKNKKFSHPKNLVKFGFKVFSQQDEDGIIEEIFNRIGVSKKKFIEIGVETGIECNTTYLLYKGWSGLWIEGNSCFRNSIEANFADYLQQKLIVEFEKVNPKNINKIISKHHKKFEEIDLLSIDIGTHTYHTLKNINYINSRVIVLEYNAKYGPSINWVSEYNTNLLWDGSDYYGASLKSFDEILQNKYKLVCCNITGANAFFVRNDLLSDKFINDFSPEYHFNEENYWLRLAFKKTYNIRIK
jgi:hypothetical protein